MTELSFLIDLLLNHDVSKETKAVIAERIKYVEGTLVKSSNPVLGWTPPNNSTSQAPSTLALMAKHGDPVIAPTAAVPVENVAQTAATQQALAQRNEMIRAGMSGKPMAGQTSPKKFRGELR